MQYANELETRKFEIYMWKFTFGIDSCDVKVTDFDVGRNIWLVSPFNKKKRKKA